MIIFFIHILILIIIIIINFRYDMGRKGSGYGLSGFALIAVTVRQLTQKYQLLLLPITMFIGAEQAFIAVDFTAVSVF